MSKTIDDSGNHSGEEDTVEIVCIWCNGTGIVTQSPFLPVGHYEECMCNWLDNL